MALTAKAKSIADKVNKKYGDGTIVLGTDVVVPPRITSGSLSLDVALGGGWPANQWNEIIGEESAGKTAIALHTIAANQLLDPEYLSVWVAAEHYNDEYAAMIGVDNERVIVVNTNLMSVSYQIVIEYLESKEVDCIVIDSLPALIPDREDEKEVGETTPGLGALLTGQFFRKAGAYTKRSMDGSERPVLGLMINQYREKIGVMYGDNRTTPGGKAKNFAYWTRVEARRAEWLTEKRDGYDKPVPVGQVIAARCIKNKSAASQRVAFMDFYFAENDYGFYAGEFDSTKEIINVGIIFDVLQRQGNSWFYEGEKIGSNKQTMIDTVYSTPELKEGIEKRVLAIVSTGKYHKNTDEYDHAE